jgi:RecA-family ATPase
VSTLAELACAPLWVGWRQETRGGAVTKAPYNPRTGALAACNNSATWAARSEAERWAAAEHGDGVGIVLGEIGDTILCGVDLDSCRDRDTEEIEVWALEVIARFDSYTEVSPSGTGVKLFFRVAGADKPQLDVLFNGQSGRQFKRGGGVHPAAIEVYRGNRFFTTTGDAISAREDLRLVNVDAIRWVICEAGPKFAGKANGAGKDDSRSAKAFRVGAAIASAGRPYEEIRAALLASDDPDIVAWTLEKGLSNGERELRRIFGRAAGQEDVAELPVVSVSSFAGNPAPPRPWHVVDMIPGRQVTLLGGDGGVGKSIVAKQLGVATAAGRDWFGMTPACGAVVYLSAEDDLDELNRRIEAIAANYGVKLAELADFHLVPLAGRDAVLGAPMKPGIIAPTPVWRGLEAVVERIRPRLVIVDTLADAYAGNENSRPEARQFVGLLRGMAIDRELAVVLLAHPSLSGLTSGSGTSGSTAWSNSVRSRLYLDKVKDVDGADIESDLRIFSTKKLNYGPDTLKFRLRWSEGCFVLDGDAREFDRVVVDAKAEKVFLDLLASFIAQGRAASASRGPTYAPALFEKLPNALGVGRKAFAAAMERLLTVGKIRVEQFGPPSKLRTRLVFAKPKLVVDNPEDGLF